MKTTNFKAFAGIALVSFVLATTHAQNFVRTNAPNTGTNYSFTRGAGATLQALGERLSLEDQFQGVDQLTVEPDGQFTVLERIEAGKHQISKCAGAPALLGWATGNLPEPRNNPQVGMANMRTAMPALQRAKPVKVGADGVTYASVTLPKQQRQTRIVKDRSADEIAREIVDWITGRS